MATGAAYILLMVMVSMEALLLLVAAGAAGTSGAAVSGRTIRLPSDARVPAGVAADLVRAMATAKTKLGDDEKRPWECCDRPIFIRTRTWPGICICADTVEQCASTCESCEELDDGGYRCVDKYRGDDPGPRCHEDGGAGDHDWARRLARGHRF